MEKALTNVYNQTIMDLIDLFLAVDSDGFVGTFSSNWSRIIYALSLARKKYSPPVVSVDLLYNHWVITYGQGPHENCCPQQIVCFDP